MDQTLASIHGYIVQFETLKEIRNIEAHDQLHFSSKTNIKSKIK